MSKPVLALELVSRHFAADGWFSPDPAPVRAVDGVSLVLRPGETVGLVGESGCGKTTIGRLALRLEVPTAGRILWQGEDVSGLDEQDLRPRRRWVQAIFQDPYASLNPKMRVVDSIAEPLMHMGIGDPAERRERVAWLLEAVGLRPDEARRRPHAFSGGQRQRIAIARALAPGPAAVVCDEAVSALDVSIRAQILNLLMRLQDELGQSYLFISHDLEIVRHVSHRVVVIYLGKAVESGPIKPLFDQPAHPYTHALLASAPVHDPALRRHRIPLAGEIPSPPRHSAWLPISYPLPSRRNPLPNRVA